MKPPPGKEDEWRELYGPFPQPGAEAALHDVLYGGGGGLPKAEIHKLTKQLLQWHMKINPTGR
jgi:hypothetical protein